MWPKGNIERQPSTDKPLEGFIMQDDDDYISTLVTPDMLEDPDEPGIHPWEAMSRQLEAELVESGLTKYRSELRPGVEPKYIVTFVPRKTPPMARQSKPAPMCPSCGPTLDEKGRCYACWGDVFGLCENCGSILEEDHSCPKCSV